MPTSPACCQVGIPQEPTLTSTITHFPRSRVRHREVHRAIMYGVRTGSTGDVLVGPFGLGPAAKRPKLRGGGKGLTPVPTVNPFAGGAGAGWLVGQKWSPFVTVRRIYRPFSSQSALYDNLRFEVTALWPLRALDAVEYPPHCCKAQSPNANASTKAGESNRHATVLTITPRDGLNVAA